ncbi:GntR family transcriptional regulator [Polaromonas sp.]|uniref:GntR family transcriptional regulator n=1 Tax=Polaromonas sp. TaxID=1869339 RepID=UPI002FC60428
MTSASDISNRIIEAVMAQKLAPGARLGEQQLAMLFDCSRTIVREALTRLAARGIVTVSSRRGWYVIEPSQEEAREAFEARRVIEMGLIRCTPDVSKAAIKQLKSHLAREKAAVKGSDVGLRSFLLGDFHVCLAECLGNSLLADTLRDFTARTTLIAMLYQSSHDAAQSCEEHVQIVQALEKGDLALAEKLMQAHIGSVQAALKLQAANGDPLAQLRNALSPLSPPKPKTAQELHTSVRKPGAHEGHGPPRRAAPSKASPHGGQRSTRSDERGGEFSEEPSTYLGALL